MGEPETFSELKELARALPKNVMVPAHHIHSLLDETERLVERIADLERQLAEMQPRCTELEKFNVGLADENEKLRNFLRQVSCMMHLWDVGLDSYDGEDYIEALEVWDELLPKIDSELDRTDTPTPDELRNYEARKPK